MRNRSSYTQRAYADNVARFARHVGRFPERLGAKEIRAYQIYLTTERQLAPSSITIAISARAFPIASPSSGRCSRS